MDTETLRNLLLRIAAALGEPPVALFLKIDHAFLPACVVGCQAPADLKISQTGILIEYLKTVEAGHAVSIDMLPSLDDRINDERSALESMDTIWILPIFVQQQLAGFVSLGEISDNRLFRDSDRQLIGIISELVTLGLENLEQANEIKRSKILTQELVIAREMYEGLFPKTFSEVQGLECSADCRQVYEIGGDYYDFISLPDGRVAFAIGDVSGKSITAALIVANLRASLRREMSRHTENLAGLIDHLNKLVYDVSPISRFVTFFYAQYDPKTSRLQYVNAGHLPPLLLRRKPFDQPPRFLKEGGTVIGAFEDSIYKQATEILQPGDIIVCYTDGITEAVDSNGEEWGLERLIALVAQNYGTLTPSEIVAHLFRTVDEFTAGAKQHDDMTVLVVKAL